MDLSTVQDKLAALFGRGTSHRRAVFTWVHCVVAWSDSAPPLPAADWEVARFTPRRWARSSAARREQTGVQGAIIGGLAVAVRGRPRVTLDVDAIVVLGQTSLAEFFHCSERFLKPS